MDTTPLLGMDKASEFARKGQFIFAIKHLETRNPYLTREQAKSAVEELGYGDGMEEKRQRSVGELFF